MRASESFDATRINAHQHVAIRRVAYYQDRHRGSAPAEHVFVVFREDGSEVWHSDLRSFAHTPQALFDKIMLEKADRHQVDDLLAGGSMTETLIHFTLLNVDTTMVAPLIIGVFGFTQEPSYRLYRYEDARILIGSDDSRLTNVGELLAEHDLAIPR